MNKKWVTIGVVGVLVLGGGYWGYKHFTAKPVLASNITAKAKMGDVNKVITATGTVNFPHAIPLIFQQDGKIVQLNVKAGDSVKAGQVLAKTDDTKLSTAVLQAQAGLNSAYAKLQSLKDGFNVQTRAKAQAALAGDQAKVADMQQQVATAKAADLPSAQANLTSAQANVTSDQYDVQQQAQGPKAGDLQSAQADIEIAQVQLTSAKADLSNSEIIAPMDAVVVSAPLLLYQQSDPKTSIITVTPAGDKLEVDASIDQSDITQVKVGQKVDVTLDASPNQHNTGVVSSVAVQGTIVSNVTTFTVTATLDNASASLRAGMNANINIIVAEAKNVLTVPSEAVKTRGQQTGVTAPSTSTSTTTSSSTTNQPKNAGNARFAGAGGNIKYIPVVIGLDDGTNVEIKSGLTEGQDVIIGTRSSSTAAKTTSSGFSLGGGGGARAMGGGGGTRGN
jgi:HlyD family secretion protein